jgi:hypothetical protein
MGLFKKKVDPINERARALNAEIDALENRIKKLTQQAEGAQGPRLRSTVLPSGASVGPAAGEPVFETVHQERLTDANDSATTPQHFNDLGVRKFDLWSLWERLRKQFSSRPMANPKLINYLAAGSIQGLRPLRYEKRVARNRFFLLFACMLGICLFLFYWLVHRR